MLPAAIRNLMPFLAILAVFTIFYAGLVAMGQDDLKSLIAYSSVGHMGIVLLGAVSMTELGVAGAIYQMISHGLIAALLFGICGVINKADGTRMISELDGLGEKYPMIAGVLVFSSLAGLGLPGLSGFVAEVTVFMGVFEVWRVIAVFAVISLIVTASYFIWMLKRTVFGVADNEEGFGFKKIYWILFSPLIFLVTLLGVYPSVLFNVINSFLSSVSTILI